jgi:hypothetical protein
MLLALAICYTEAESSSLAASGLYTGSRAATVCLAASSISNRQGSAIKDGEAIADGPVYCS